MARRSLRVHADSLGLGSQRSWGAHGGDLPASWVWGHRKKCLLLLRISGGLHTSSHWLENTPKVLMISSTLKPMRPQFPMSRMGRHAHPTPHTARSQRDITWGPDKCPMLRPEGQTRMTPSAPTQCLKVPTNPLSLEANQPVTASDGQIHVSGMRCWGEQSPE